MKNPSREQIASLQQSLSLPADIQVTGYLGTGARAHVFQATLGKDRVIAKVYQQEAVQKYRHRYGTDIAEFEYQRNQSLFALAPIRKHVARPYRVYPESSEYTHCMIQEYITIGATDIRKVFTVGRSIRRVIQ